jgi:SUF system NifU family Fe-S assembly protein
MSVYDGLVLEHYRNPRNRGEVAGATAVGEASNPLCGDRIRLSTRVVDGRVADIAFAGDACAICVASASMLTERVRGQSLAEVGRIANADVVAALDSSIPPARVRCATLPLDALRRALGVNPGTRDLVAIVLAAGRATRFGGDKVTAPLRGEPVIRHVVRAFDGMVGRVVVVVAGNEPSVRAALADRLSPDGGNSPIEIVVNDRAAEGMSSSIATGIGAAADAAAVIVALGDQPGIERPVLAAVIDGWRGGGGVIVSPSYRGVRAPPVVFARSVFEEMAGLSGDIGARALIERDPSRVMVVDVDHAPPADIDTRADLAALELPA